MKRIIISTLILAVLSGCSVYRKYPRTAEVDRNLYGKEYSSEDSTSIVERVVYGYLPATADRHGLGAQY